jgi:T-complex protein 1 subunit beta
MVIGKEVDELERETPGKRYDAIVALSRALQAIPTIIADNAGLDSAELISQLQAKHHKENSITGIDVITGRVSSQTSIVFSHYIYAYEISIGG